MLISIILSGPSSFLFGNNSSLNAYRSRYNERQMKVNYLEINKKIKHDSLILGASRSTYLNTSSFEDEGIFNFSVSNMTSKEFIDFTNFFEQKYGTPKNIYMFLDFVGMLLPQDSLKDETVSNINNTEYLLSSLFSLTTLKRSLYNLLWSYQKETGHRAYLSNLDVVKDRVDEETSKDMLPLLKVLPGVKKLLIRLNQCGIKSFITTTDITSRAKIAMEALKFDCYFDKKNSNRQWCTDLFTSASSLVQAYQTKLEALVEIPVNSLSTFFT